MRSRPLGQNQAPFPGRLSAHRSLFLVLFGLIVISLVLPACGSATSPAGPTSAPAAPPMPAARDSAAVAKGGAAQSSLAVAPAAAPTTAPAAAAPSGTQNNPSLDYIPTDRLVIRKDRKSVV